MTRAYASARKPETPRAASVQGRAKDTVAETRGNIGAEDRWTELAVILLDMLEATGPDAVLAHGPGRPSPSKPADGSELSPDREATTATEGGVPPAPASLPAGSDVALLKANQKAVDPAEVPMPDFPQGGRPLPDAPRPTAPAMAGPKPDTAPAAPPAAGSGEASPLGIVRSWQGQVKAGGAAIAPPKVTVPANGAAKVEDAGRKAKARNGEARTGLTKDAIATVPKAPELDTTPPAPPPPNPVPDHTQKVLDASGKRLPAQASLPLQNSPERKVEGQNIGGSTPPLGVRPVSPDLFQVLITPAAKSLAQLPAGVSAEDVKAGMESPEQRRVREALATLTATGDAPDRKGRGPQVISPDQGPFKAEGVAPQDRAKIGELVARLLANTGDTAQDILVRLRKNAFAQEALYKNFPDICTDLLGSLETALATDLRDVADAAGISGAELDELVAKRRKELEDEKTKAAETVTKLADDTKKTVTEEGQKTSDAIAGAAEAAEEETLRRQTAVAGENDPTVVHARRDKIVAWFREHVTTQITTYQRAGDKRQTELKTAQTEQEDAYKTLAQREIYTVMTPSPPRAERNQADKVREKALADVSVEIRVWSDGQIKTLGEHFRKALTLAADTTRGYRKTIEDAGSAGIEAARRWAEDKVLAGKSWWQRFVARIKRWLGEAKDVNEQWRVRRGRENAKSIADDLLAADLAAKVLAKDVDATTKQQIDQMTDAQKVAFGTFYSKNKGKHPLDFAADRLADNLARDHQSGANEKFEAALIAMPVAGGDTGTANKLNDVARAQGAGFDAARISQNVHAAMDQWGTDEQKIFDNLRSLTVLQGHVVRKMYRAMYHSDLDDDLDSEMGGEELDQAMAELEGKQSKADAIALHDAMAGLGTDEATIMRTLRNKSEAEREAIRAEYQRMYGVSLDADLKDDLSDGNEIKQADALLAGDNELADAIELDEAMRGGIISSGTDEKRIEEVQNRVRSEVLAMAKGQNWTSEQMEAEVRRRMGLIEAKFEKEYGKEEQYNAPGLEGKTALRRAFKSELSGAELDLANALQDNDLIKADAARIEIERTGFYASDDKINEVLRSQYERALDARRLDEGPARNMRVRRLVDDLRKQTNPVVSEQEISRRRMALERDMEKELQAGAQQDSRMSMDSLKQVYQDKYFWPLEYVVEVNMSGEDRNKARNMLAQGGKLDPLQEIEYATRTDGTDEDTVRRVIGTMTKAELDVLADQWEKRHPGKKFRDMLVDELDGRDLSDVLDMYDYGQPTSALEEIAQEERRVERETKHLTGVLGGAAAQHEADWMQSELERLQTLKTGLTRTDWPDTDEARDERAQLSDELDHRVERVQAAVEDHRRRIDSVTDMASQAVGIVVGLVVAAVVTVLTAGTAGPIMVAVIASLYATVATMATKLLIKGGAYGTQDFALDAAVGVVDAAMSAATAGLGTKILGPIKKLVSGTKVPALAGKLGRTGVAQRLAKMEGMGLAARAGRRLAPTREGVERAMAGFVAEGLEDAASSVPSAMIQTMADDNVWKGDPLANFLSGTGMSVLQSAAMSRAMHAGRTVAGGAFNLVHSKLTEPGNIGRVRELNRLITEHFGSFRNENPNASLGDFMASPQGRKLNAEIEQKGLLKEIRASAEAADQAAGATSSARTADPDMTRPAAEAGMADGTPMAGKPDARLEAMQAVLPEGMRKGMSVTADPDLPGRSVHVEPLRIGNRIVGVDVRVGPGATALDVALHAGTIHAMQKYMGVLGNIRRALHDLIHRVNATGLTVGSRGWEAQLELQKLGGLVHERLDSLSGQRLDFDGQVRALSDFQALESQFHQHETILADPSLRNQPGRGFVAGESARFPEDGPLADGTTSRRISDLELDPDELAGTPRKDRDGAAATLADLQKLNVKERQAADGSLTEAGRADLILRLEAMRALLDLKTKSGRAEARRILYDTALLFGASPKALLKHITSKTGEPNVRRMLRRPAVEEPTANRGKDATTTETSDKDFLRILHQAMPRDPNAPARAGFEEIMEGIRNKQAGAQEKLNDLSSAPKDYEVKNVTWAELDGMLRGNRKGDPNTVNPDTGTLHIGDGQIVFDARYLESGARATDDQNNPLFRFRQDFPPFSQTGKIVLQFGDGRMRVWRTPDNTLVVETKVSDSVMRQGHEKRLPTHREAKLSGPATELAHAAGPGLGMDVPFGIRRALTIVNQEIQNRGIETYMAALRDHAPPGVEFVYRVEIADQGIDSRLAGATYGIDMILDGKRVPFAEFAVRTDPLPADLKAGDPDAAKLVHIDPVEPVGISRLDPATRMFVDAFRDTVAAPDAITNRKVVAAPSVADRVAQFRRLTPAEVAQLPARDNRVQTQEVPAAVHYDHDAFVAAVARDVYRSDHPQTIVIDLRGSDLTGPQIDRLKKALGPMIYGRKGAEVVVIDDPKKAVP